jgi:hypothetical protein
VRLADVSAAALMYSSDFDGRLVGNDPSSVDNGPGAGLAGGFMDEKAPRNWAKSIMPYLDNGSALRCLARIESQHFSSVALVERRA